MDVDWSWGWGPSNAVVNNAHFGDNLPWDIVRILVCIGGLALMWNILRVMVEQHRRTINFGPGQGARLIALLIADVSLSMTELWVVGTPATPRLLMSLAVVCVGTYGVAQMRRQQHDQPIVR